MQQSFDPFGSAAGSSVGRLVRTRWSLRWCTINECYWHSRQRRTTVEQPNRYKYAYLESNDASTVHPCTVTKRHVYLFIQYRQSKCPQVWTTGTIPLSIWYLYESKEGIMYNLEQLKKEQMFYCTHCTFVVILKSDLKSPENQLIILVRESIPVKGRKIL